MQKWTRIWGKRSNFQFGDNFRALLYPENVFCEKIKTNQRLLSTRQKKEI